MLIHKRSLYAVLVVALSASTGVLAGEISTVAGNGDITVQPGQGNLGDGGPALSATMFQPRGVAVAGDGTIYFADTGNFRVRRIGTDGVITTVAGSGVHGNTGDGGDATAATLSDVLAVAIDPTGSLLYIADDSNGRVRRVDLSSGQIDGVTDIAFPQGIAVDNNGDILVSETALCSVRKIDASTFAVTTVAGSDVCDSRGDLGLATEAAILFPTRISVDDDDNLYIVEAGTDTVRRVDAASGVITTVAGGGFEFPGFGPATSFYIGTVTDVAAGGPNELFVSNEGRVFRIDLATGLLAAYAGTGVLDFGGDGGPATLCNLNLVGGIAYDDVTGELVLSDANNARIRVVQPGSDETLDLIVDLTMTQEFLDAVTAVAGSVVMVEVDGREFLIVPNLTTVGVDVTVTGNDSLLVIDMSQLAALGGNLSILGNLTLTTLDLSSLATIDGSLHIESNSNLDTVLIGGVTSIAGDLTIIGTAATVLTLNNLQTIDGSLTIENNDFVTTIDLSGLAIVGGSLTIEGNDAAEVIDLGNVTTIAGDLTIENNGDATVDIGSLETIDGNLNVESTGTGAFDGDVCVGGVSDIDLAGYASITAQTADGGATFITLEDGSVMTLEIQPETFPSCVEFSISRVATVSETGTDADGNEATIDPVLAYQFLFTVPTLGVPAELTFDIVLSTLPASRQAEILDAVASGTITLVTKGDNLGDVFTAFEVCGAGDAPTVDGCVTVEALDSNGQPTSGTPHTIRFTGVVGHFSTWGVAIVTSLAGTEQCPTPSSDLCADTTGFDSAFAASYSRATGRPVTVTNTFGATAGGAVLVVHNNGCSSAVATLNGQRILTPNDFNQNVTCFTRGVQLQDANTLQVEVRSVPGCSIDISFEQLEACVSDSGGGGGDLGAANCAASGASTPAVLGLAALGFALRRRRR